MKTLILLGLALSYLSALDNITDTTEEPQRSRGSSATSYVDKPDDDNRNPFQDLLTPDHASYAKNPNDVEELYCAEIIQYFPGFFCSQQGYFGRGGNGITFIIHDEEKREYMLKVEEDVSKRGVTGLLKSQGHKNVIELRKADIIGNHMVQIIAFADNGSLKSYHRNNPVLFANDTFVLEFFGQIVDGIGHIHSKNIVHADIKPQNIVVDRDGVPKIIDFDLCVHSFEKKGGRGTSSYMPPEVYAVWSKSRMHYTEKVDVYALGVTLFYLLNENYPFSGDGNDEVYDLLKRKTFLLRHGTRLDLAKLFDQSFRWNGNERLTLTEFKQRLIDAASPAHPQKRLRYDENLLIDGENIFFEELELSDGFEREIQAAHKATIILLVGLVIFWIAKKDLSVRLHLRSLGKQHKSLDFA